MSPCNWRGGGGGGGSLFFKGSNSEIMTKMLQETKTSFREKILVQIFLMTKQNPPLWK